ncbi:hypothetical protein C4559_06445 [Candidatus Microgenomates bacterium]|nr:MAG: hypothetical protein C4559_06445 [Candidatus Microgenomates bacterium]
MNIDKHQIYSHWVDELATISEEDFFPTFRQFLDLLVAENPGKIKILEDEKKKEDVELNRLAEIALKNLEELLNKVKQEIRKEKLQPVDCLNEYKRIENGETSESVPDDLYHAIRQTIEIYRKNDKLKAFDDLLSANENFWYLDYVKVCQRYPSYKEYQRANSIYKQKDKEEIWGIYDYLKWATIFFKEVLPESAGKLVRPEIINKLKRLTLYLLTPEAQKIVEQIDFTDTAIERQEQTNPLLPSGWELKEDGKIPKIVKDDSDLFVFPNNWSSKYKHFKCLWECYGVKKDYKEVYEFESKLKYPEKGVWRINRNMRGIVNKLRKEFENKNLPIHIETNKGFILTIF